MSAQALVMSPNEVRARYAGEGEGRTVDEVHETARRCLACAGAAWLGLSALLDRIAPIPDRLIAIIDTAEICEVTARSLMRGSTQIRRLCALTGVICSEAADAAGSEPELEEFVVAAQRCARSCKSISEAVS
jgi:hypothetical protein